LAAIRLRFFARFSRCESIDFMHGACSDFAGNQVKGVKMAVLQGVRAV
jgi:hypothetical protein